MIYLFHGDDNFKSRQVFYGWIAKYPQKIRFFAKEISSENLTTYNQGLFSKQEKTAFVLEDLFSLPKKKLEEVIDSINKIKDKDVLIWEKKQITPAKIKMLGPKTQAFLFKIPAVIFSFLDSIGKESKEVLIRKLNLTSKKQPPELILYLLTRRFKDLLLGKINIDKLRMAPWQKNKISSQIDQLDLDQIRLMYLKLIEIDNKNKTGQLGNSLTRALINFVAEI